MPLYQPLKGDVIIFYTYPGLGPYVVVEFKLAGIFNAPEVLNSCSDEFQCAESFFSWRAVRTVYPTNAVCLPSPSRTWDLSLSGQNHYNGGLDAGHRTS